MTSRKKPRNRQHRQPQQAAENSRTSFKRTSAHFDAPDAEERVVVSLIEETLDVDKEWVEAGALELRKTIEARNETVPVEVAHKELYIERVAVNRLLAYGEQTEPRQEGDCW